MAVAALEGYDYANLRALQYWESIYCPPAFQPQSPADDLTVALTDTFSSKVFFKDLLETPEGREIGKRWRGLRQDSGDSKVFARKAIEVYKSLGIDPKKKVVIYSDGLHVEKCIELAQFSKEVGIGAGFGESSFGGQGVFQRAWLSLIQLLSLRRWHKFHKRFPGGRGSFHTS